MTFRISHPIYWFPEFLSLIKGHSFIISPSPPKKQIYSPTAYQRRNKSQCITAAALVMPISQCDLCTHFILKMTLPSICLSRMSYLFQANTFKPAQPPFCPARLPRSQISTNTKKGTSADACRDQRNWRQNRQSFYFSCISKKPFEGECSTWCVSGKQRDRLKIQKAVSSFYILSPYLDIRATYPR